jgi:hypothetical protein
VPAAPPLLGSTGSTTFVLAAVLVALGLAMLVTALWLVRATRTDVRALAPLEVMGDRGFARRDADARAAALAGVRPEGALGPAPMLDLDEPDGAATAVPAPAAVPAPEPAPEPATPPAAAPDAERGPQPEAATTEDEPAGPEDEPAGSGDAHPVQAEDAVEAQDVVEADEAVEADEPAPQAS